VVVERLVDLVDEDDGEAGEHDLLDTVGVAPDLPLPPDLDTFRPEVPISSWAAA
jgi:hypothetical protein